MTCCGVLCCALQAGRKLAYWQCREKRPSHLVTNEEFHEFSMDVSAPKPDSCPQREIDKQVLEMVTTANVQNKEGGSILRGDGIKPSMATDI